MILSPRQTASWLMSHDISFGAVCRCVCTLLCWFAMTTVHAQPGTWQYYLAYGEPQQIEKAEQGLFVKASGNLYHYNLNDQSVTTFDRSNGLNGGQLSHIKWCSEAHRLIAIYTNANIDLINPEGEVTNMPDLYMATMAGSKKVHRIVTDGSIAYLCVGSSIVKIDVANAHVVETYTLGSDVWNVMPVDGNLYANTAASGVMVGRMSDNLINPANWHSTSHFPESIYDAYRGDYDAYISIVSQINAGGPHYNEFNSLWFVNGCLYGVGGGWYDGGQMDRTAQWQQMDREGHWQRIDAPMKKDAVSMAIDPADATHLYIATCGNGLFEFRNGQSVAQYTAGNSLLASAIPGNNNYVRVDGLFYDRQHRLWMTNSETQHPLIRMNSEGTMESLDHPSLFYNGTPLTILRNPTTDHTGKVWLVNSHHHHPCLVRIDPETDEVDRFDALRNQDETPLRDIYSFNCVAEDKDGNIWAGTNQGPLMLTPQQQQSPDYGYTQIVVPRNDGSGYGDYLLEGISVTAMAIDGGNRKWIGTESNGVYVISSDNTTEVVHYTSADSGLLSDRIESIAIDGQTGRVYIGTEEGLCAVVSDATDAAEKMEKGVVRAYPNPVAPDYTGPITIEGLSYDADVRIVNTAGMLVARGRSTGGTYIWDGCDSKGRRVASGVYHVLTATSDGHRGTVCRIAIIR